MADTAITTLGANIATQRFAARLGQSELARTAGISVPYLSDIERGKREPNVFVVARIAAALSVTVDDLLTPRERFPVYATESDGSGELLGVVKAHTPGDAVETAGRRWPLLHRLGKLLVSAPTPERES